ncbi:uncharacterized protein (UPF0262 family) (plasmid) [Ensifer sp. WSM1721]|uniref:UPF0262 family protein n=1 Tax=Ensifer sp. WSM1721 TaxID=1041159 RepID=UPI0004B9572D|nr:UPF0262 family protein [Ensifer sp. WSM1721]
MTAAVFRLSDVSLDRSLGSSVARIEREHAVALCDLLEDNTFVPIGHEGGPYRLDLALADARLALRISTEKGTHVISHYLSLAPFRRLFKNYVLICEGYYDAKICSSPERLAAIDMRRRALHDGAADLLRRQLAPKAAVDKNTARRLFTLIYVLLMRDASFGDRLVCAEGKPLPDKSSNQVPEDECGIPENEGQGITAPRRTSTWTAV